MKSVTKCYALAGLLLPALAVAGGSYDYVELGYINAEFDAGPADLDGDGFRIEASVSATDAVFVYANYADIGLDLGIDATLLEIGGGWHTPLSNSTDFVATLAYVNVEADAGGGLSADDDGFGISAGLRGTPADRIELRGRILYEDLDDSNTSLEIFGDYYFTENFSLGAGFLIDDDASAWLLQGRFHFGR